MKVIELEKYLIDKGAVTVQFGRQQIDSKGIWIMTYHYIEMNFKNVPFRIYYYSTGTIYSGDIEFIAIEDFEKEKCSGFPWKDGMEEQLVNYLLHYKENKALKRIGEDF